MLADNDEFNALFDTAAQEIKTFLLAYHEGKLDSDELETYIQESIKVRFKNYGLEDSITRVGRNPHIKIGPQERLCKPALYLFERGKPTKALLTAVYLGAVYAHQREQVMSFMKEKAWDLALVEDVMDVVLKGERSKVLFTSESGILKLEISRLRRELFHKCLERDAFDYYMRESGHTNDDFIGAAYKEGVALHDTLFAKRADSRENIPAMAKQSSFKPVNGACWPLEKGVDEMKSSASSNRDASSVVLKARSKPAGHVLLSNDQHAFKGAPVFKDRKEVAQEVL